MVLQPSEMEFFLLHIVFLLICVLWAHRVCPLLHLPKDSREDPQDEEELETLHRHNLPEEASISIGASNQTGWDGRAAVSSSRLQFAKCSLAFAQNSAALRGAGQSLRHYSRTLGRGQRGSDRQRRIKGGAQSSPLPAEWVEGRLADGCCGSWETEQAPILLSKLLARLGSLSQVV